MIILSRCNFTKIWGQSAPPSVTKSFWRCLFSFLDVSVGHPHGSASLGHIGCHHASSADFGIIANFHIFHNTHMRANIHVVANGGRCAMVGADRKKLRNVAIAANGGAAINHDAHPVTDVKALAYPRS